MMSFSIVAPVGPVYTLSQLRIAATNVLENAAITASSTAAGFDPYAVIDSRPSTYWKPASPAYTHTLTFGLAIAERVDSFALYSSNLAELGCAVTFEYSTDGITFTTLCSATPGGTAPMHISFTEVIAAWFRVTISSTTPVAPQIGVIYACKEFRPELGQCVGFTPPTLGGQPVVLTNNSMAPAWLGRALRSRIPYEGSIDLDFIEPERARLEYAPLFARLAERPFFLKWHGSAFPYETAYCWTDNANTTASYKKPNFMRGEIKFSGLVA